MKRKHYFDRADKDEVYRFILSFSDGEELLKNVNEALNKYGLVVNDKKELESLIRDLMVSVANNAPDSNELCKRANKFLDRLVE